VRSRGVFLCLLLGGLAIAPGASAQSSTDPAPTSPPGRTYSLPLDSGRKDAAPGSSGGGSPTLRSDNGFGSSSAVPGDPSAAPGGTGAGEKGEAQREGNEGPVNASQSAEATDTGNASEPLNFALLGLIAVVGAGAGIAASKARGRTGGD